MIAGAPPTSSARAQIQLTLDTFGLGSLADMVWGWYLGGKPAEQIMLDLRQTPQYVQRFPAMQTLAKKGMAISEADYINYERQVAGLFRAYGLPKGFYDAPEDFTKFIGNEVSVSEVEERLKIASAAMYQSPPEVRAELSRMYGVDSGHLLAYWIDPNKAFPIIQQRFAASQVAGAADAARFGALTRQEAEQLAQRGVTAETAAKGFGYLQQTAQLLTPLPGEEGYSKLTRPEEFGAAFGYDPKAQLKLQQEADKRKAALSAGGQFVTTTKGVEGLTPQDRS